MRTNMVLTAGAGLLAAMFLTTSLAIPAGAAAEKETVITGSIDGTETDVLVGLPPTGINVNAVVGGVASHLGRFAYVYHVDVVLPAGTATGKGQFIAANGDVIQLDIVGTSVPGVEPNTGDITEIDTVTGGTGRFAGATGKITILRVVDLGTGDTSGTVAGSVFTLAGAH